MKTKTSILAALVAMAGSASVMAQTVYSLNVVGYVNVTLKPGFNLIGNQLVNGSNKLNEVIPTAPDGALVYKFLPGGTFQVDVYNANSAVAPVGWYDNTTGDPSVMTVGPGEGFFFNNPASTNVTVTLVGEVKTGTNTVNLAPGFSLVSSVVPASYPLNTPDFPAVDGMLYYAFDNGVFTVDVFNNNSAVAPIGWYDNTTGDPVTVQPAVGQGFFVNNPNSTSVAWTRSYSIN